MAKTWRELQKSALRAQIFETSLRLFRTQGFDSTTVEQIVAEVGIAKGTFFNHFPTKVAVLVEWYRDLTLAALSEAESRAHATACDALRALAVALASRTAADPDLWDAKTRNAFADVELRSKESDLDRLLVGYCRRYLSAGKARGEMDQDLDEQLVADMFGAVLTGTGHSWVVSGHRFDLPKIVAARVDFLFRAAAPEPTPAPGGQGDRR